MTPFLRRVVSIGRTDLRIELRDRSSWLFYLVLPLHVHCDPRRGHRRLRKRGRAARGRRTQRPIRRSPSSSSTRSRPRRGLGDHDRRRPDRRSGSRARDARLLIPVGFGAAIQAGLPKALQLSNADERRQRHRRPASRSGRPAGQLASAVTAARIAIGPGERAPAVRAPTPSVRPSSPRRCARRPPVAGGAHAPVRRHDRARVGPRSPAASASSRRASSSPGR